MVREHMHRCKVCSRSFASDRLLDMHISESHDSFFAVMAERQPSYRCVVDGCDTLSWSDKERSVHLVEDHHFPETYSFRKPAPRRKELMASNKIRGSKVESVSDAVPPKDTQMEVEEEVHKRKGHRQRKKKGKKEHEAMMDEGGDKADCKGSDGMEIDGDAQNCDISAKVPASISFGRRGRRSTRIS